MVYQNVLPFLPDVVPLVALQGTPVFTNIIPHAPHTSARGGTALRLVPQPLLG